MHGISSVEFTDSIFLSFFPSCSCRLYQAWPNGFFTLFIWYCFFYSGSTLSFLSLSLLLYDLWACLPSLAIFTVYRNAYVRFDLFVFLSRYILFYGLVFMCALKTESQTIFIILSFLPISAFVVLLKWMWQSRDSHSK